MSAEEQTPADPVMQHVEQLISRLLLGGVLLSMAAVLVGLILIFAHHPENLVAATALERLTTPGAAFPKTLAGVARGIAAGRGQAIVVLGLLFLIATPILRVAVSMIGFAWQRDYMYTAFCAAVLVVLLASFFLGNVE